MRREAEQRLADADRLDATASADDRSDSAHLLRLLVLGLLLKVVHIVTVGRPSRSGQKYDAIFLALPETIQKQLLALAGERIGPSALGNNHLAVLAEWGSNFVSLRYPYERYENLTDMNIVRSDESGSKTEHPLTTPHSATTPRNCLDSSTRFAALRTRLARLGIAPVAPPAQRTAST